jgi:hypothetical protein
MHGSVDGNRALYPAALDSFAVHPPPHRVSMSVSVRVSASPQHTH